MKKAVLGFVLFVVILTAFFIYLVWSNLGLIKRMVGYNVPTLTELPVIKSDGDPPAGGGFLKVPEGFRISVAAKGLENPRVILFDPKGRMLVSETKAGRISIFENIKLDEHCLQARPVNTGLACKTTKRVLIDGLNLPHGLDFFKDSKTGTTYLYIAETNQVARYSYDVNTGRLASTTGQNITTLPADGRHFTRTIAFGPNYRQIPIISGFKKVQTLNPEKLYISVGSSCDVCEENTWKRAAILESDPEGTFTAEFAGGLRNSVFFTFHPKTKEIWATEMGRDDLGDNLPPDEINIIKVAGSEDKFGAKRYGWPFCYGDKIRDKKFNPEKFERIDMSSDCSKTESPVIEIPAHSAPLGLAFIPEAHSTGSGQASGWPKEWEGDLLVAFHGSWNRSEPVGYKIVRYDLDANGNVLSQKPNDFMSGWFTPSVVEGPENKILGRPVDLKFNPDGTLYISDDAAGVIYRVTSE